MLRCWNYTLLPDFTLKSPRHPVGVVGLYTHETVISTRLSDRDDDNDNHDFTQVQRKRTKRTTRSQNKKAAGTAFLSGSGSTSQSSQLVQPNNISNVSLDPVKHDLQQQKTVQDLQSVVQSQQHTIQQLSCQLQFLLSFLGITECSSVSYDDNITPGTAVLGVNSSTSTAVTHPVQQPQQRSIPTVVVRASTNSAHARAVMSMTGFPSSSYVHPSSALTYALCLHADLVSQASVTAFVHYSLVFHLLRRQAVFWV